jgi:hypothetical protein
MTKAFPNPTAIALTTSQSASPIAKQLAEGAKAAAQTGNAGDIGLKDIFDGVQSLRKELGEAKAEATAAKAEATAANARAAANARELGKVTRPMEQFRSDAMTVLEEKLGCPQKAASVYEEAMAAVQRQARLAAAAHVGKALIMPGAATALVYHERSNGALLGLFPEKHQEHVNEGGLWNMMEPLTFIGMLTAQNLAKRGTVPAAIAKPVTDAGLKVFARVAALGAEQMKRIIG